ncbi:MAG: ParA family protein [Syntrophomonadaceae bacterium]|jgi:chromosome partitioning protein
MRAIAVFNPKGGCGKTTSTLNIGFGLNSIGYRVMLVDLDPLGLLSLTLQLSNREAGTYQWIKKQASLTSVKREVRGVTVVPSNRLLAALDVEMAGIPGRETLLRQALDQVRDYDYILFDCPPGFGLLNINALVAAGNVLVPVLAEHLDLMVLSQLQDTIAGIKRHFNPHLTLLGFFVNRFNRRKINKETQAEINRLYPGLLFNSMVRDNVCVTESPTWGLDIFAYQANSSGAIDYLRLSREISSGLPRR